MAEIKDKVVTVESLKALHDYNKATYISAETPEDVGNLSINGEGISVEGDVYATGNVYADGDILVKSNDIIPIECGGTNATDGSNGLKNLLADGITVLSDYQYGDELPTAGNVGRIFFKKLTN